MSNQDITILLVDDEVNVLKALERLLRGYRIVTATHGEEALLLARDIDFNLVISDYRMYGIDGVNFLKRFGQMQPDSIKMIMTGFADLEVAQQAINDAGVFRFINKPWNDSELLHAVQQGLNYQRILKENKELADQVRKQQALLDEKDAVLRALEADEPGITQVNWSEDGAAIILDEKDFGKE